MWQLEYKHKAAWLPFFKLIAAYNSVNLSFLSLLIKTLLVLWRNHESFQPEVVHPVEELSSSILKHLVGRMNVCRWQSCVFRIKSLLYLTACHKQSSSVGFFNDFLLKQNQNKLIFCVARVTFGSSDLTWYDRKLFIMFPRVVYIWFFNTFKISYIRFFFDFIQRAHGIFLYFNPDICHLK